MGEKIDNKGATIMIITASNGYVFGGFTYIPWNTKGDRYEYKHNTKDYQGWIFSLRDDPDEPNVFKYRPLKTETYHLSPGRGWMSGFYDAFFLAENCHTNTKSYSVLGIGKKDNPASWATIQKPPEYTK